MTVRSAGTPDPPLPAGHGFSLIEVLVAMFVLVAGICIVASAMGQSSRAARLALDRAHAERALREKVAELRTSPYGSLASGSDAVTAGDVPVTRQWWVEAGPVSGTKRIRVEVSWTDGVTPAPDIDLEDPGALLDLQRLQQTLGLAVSRRLDAALLRASL